MTDLARFGDKDVEWLAPRVVLRDVGKKWQENKHPRGQPENAGEFARSPTSKAPQAGSVAPKPKLREPSPEKPLELPDSARRDASDIIAKEVFGKEDIYAYIAQVSKRAQRAIANYVGLGDDMAYEGISQDLNNKLRRGEKLDVDERVTSAALDKLFREDLTKVQKPFKTSRGLVASPELVHRLDAQLADGNVQPVDIAYMSTSVIQEEARYFLPKSQDGILFEITVPRGARAFLVDSSEPEVILPRNTPMRVTGKRMEGALPVYIMEVVPPDTQDAWSESEDEACCEKCAGNE